MNSRDYSSRGGGETVAAQRNNTLADIWRNYRHYSAAVIPHCSDAVLLRQLRYDVPWVCNRPGPRGRGATSRGATAAAPRRTGRAGRDHRTRRRGVGTKAITADSGRSALVLDRTLAAT